MNLLRNIVKFLFQRDLSDFCFFVHSSNFMYYRFLKFCSMKKKTQLLQSNNFDSIEMLNSLNADALLIWKSFWFEKITFTEKKIAQLDSKCRLQSLLIAINKRFVSEVNWLPCLNYNCDFSLSNSTVDYIRLTQVGTLK